MWVFVFFTLKDSQFVFHKLFHCLNFDFKTHKYLSCFRMLFFPQRCVCQAIIDVAAICGHLSTRTSFGKEFNKKSQNVTIGEKNSWTFVNILARQCTSPFNLTIFFWQKCAIHFWSVCLISSLMTKIINPKAIM